MVVILDAPVPVAAQVRRARARSTVRTTFLSSIPVKLEAAREEDAPIVMQASLGGPHCTVYRNHRGQLLKDVSVSDEGAREMLGGDNVQRILSGFAHSMRARDSDEEVVWPFLSDHVAIARVSSAADWQEVIHDDMQVCLRRTRAFWSGARLIGDSVFVPSHGPAFVVQLRSAKAGAITHGPMPSKLPIARAWGASLVLERGRLAPAQARAAFAPGDLVMAQISAATKAGAHSGLLHATRGSVWGSAVDLPPHPSTAARAVATALLAMSCQEVGMMDPVFIRAYAELKERLQSGVLEGMLEAVQAFHGPWLAEQTRKAALSQGPGARPVVDPYAPLGELLGYHSGPDAGPRPAV
jgi:hypothetical protein